MSETFLDHASKYSKDVIKRFNLDENDFVIEVASNDGYLLKNFQEKGIPALGIEPTEIAANLSKKIGIKVEKKFLTEASSKEITKKYGKAKLVIANNVLAHVPNLIDFRNGILNLINNNGICTIEVPHIMELIKEGTFDTIYHEHYYYFSLISLINLFKETGFEIFDVEKIKTHGGSLRIFVSKKGNFQVNSSVKKIISLENKNNMKDVKSYKKIKSKAFKCRQNLLEFLINAKKTKKNVYCYGAAAKGNTLLNFSKVDSYLIKGIFDKSPPKKGKFCPGSHIPILDEKNIEDFDIDFMILIPWNIKKELYDFLKPRIPSCKFYTVVPTLKELK
tara:strand:- start:9 stop:1010 length:1002 start_codon:yes stop_codon:yes gene_type:complete